MQAFRAAARNRALLWETDLRFTSDGWMVLMHDTTLSRTTNCIGYVAHRTARSLSRNCRLDNGQRIPSLGSFLAEAKHQGATVLLELKTEMTRARRSLLLNRIAAAGMRRQILVMSFNAEAVRLIASEPVTSLRVPTMMLSGTGPDAATAKRWGRSVGLHYTQASRAKVAEYHAAGLKVYVWTPNTRSDIDSARAAGVDVVITDLAAAYCRSRTVCR